MQTLQKLAGLEEIFDFYKLENESEAKTSVTQDEVHDPSQPWSHWLGGGGGG